MERLLRLWSPFGLNEIAYAIAPFGFTGLFVSEFYPANWLNAGVEVWLMYLFSAGVVSMLADHWSKRGLGLKRYIVIPIPRWMAVALVRGRMTLPKGKRYFLLHVRMERGLDPRKMSREMRRDIQHGLQAEWTKNAVFLGNTFGSLGRLQAKMLAERGCVEIVDGTFFPLQTLFLRPKRYQKKMFGRVWSEETKWKVVKYEIQK